jgi:hypothetical protein
MYCGSPRRAGGGNERREGREVHCEVIFRLKADATKVFNIPRSASRDLATRMNPMPTPIFYWKPT